MAFVISIHALREEGDERHAGISGRRSISIHALREEGDTGKPNWMHETRRFLSTPSARRATPLQVLDDLFILHFYPRPPRGGRHFARFMTRVLSAFLSTPSARRATDIVERLINRYSFLSTPSARRATDR